MLYDHPDRKTISIFTGLIILSILVYKYQDKLYQQNNQEDNQQNENNVEGFANNKLKKLKKLTTGKVSERFGDILNEKFKGKYKRKKEKFKNNNTALDFSKEYKEYKESFNPIFRKRSKSTYESYTNLKKCGKNFMKYFNYFKYLFHLFYFLIIL